MKAITFVSMMLLAISGATAQSVAVAPYESAATSSFQLAQDNLVTQRICMRCRN